jgi:hypothetical protein
MADDNHEVNDVRDDVGAVSRPTTRPASPAVSESCWGISERRTGGQ